MEDKLKQSEPFDATLPPAMCSQSTRTKVHELALSYDVSDGAIIRAAVEFFLTAHVIQNNIMPKPERRRRQSSKGRDKKK